MNLSKKSLFFVIIFRCTLFYRVQLQSKIAFFRSKIRFFDERIFMQNFVD